MRAIDAELVERAGNQKVNRSAAASTGIEPMGCDLLTALASEYEAEWKVRNPDRYVADHRRLDVTLVSDSVSGLAEKLRTFTELIRDLP
jgi:post-segregation antitoxin (ccd killing protein)